MVNSPIQASFPFALPVGKSGLWLTDKSPASLTVLSIDFSDMVEFMSDAGPDETYGGEFDVYFDPAQWDTKVMGLVYTDDTFLEALKAHFKEMGLLGVDSIEYTENGMQGG